MKNKAVELVVLYELLNNEQGYTIKELQKEMEKKGFQIAENTIYSYMSELRENGFKIKRVKRSYEIDKDQRSKDYLQGRNDMLRTIVQKIKYLEAHNQFYEDIIDDIKDYLMKLKDIVDNDKC